MNPKKDEGIRDAVAAELSRDSRIGTAGVEVGVEGGVVTLEGQVSTYLARQAAQVDAARVPGVREIRNRLTVRHAAPVSADPIIRLEALKTLREDPDIDADDLQVEVEAANLIVRGSVDALWKKTKVDELLGAVPGVAAVVNEVTVVPEGDLEDELIARAVMEAVERISPSTVDSMEVEVEDGVVTLSGEVPTWMDYNAVYSAVMYTDGVVDVVDRLDIETTIG